MAVKGIAGKGGSETTQETKLGKENLAQHVACEYVHVGVWQTAIWKLIRILRNS